ncbi:MAG TPA: HAD family hydrolase [Ktedonobacteraceae bacterium]|nr:HAD family hydrolase [Ktedonobacteraceae bacterium]
MITTLLFDVDGVLLIGDPWNKDLASAYNISEEMLRPFFRDAFPACLTGQADLKEALTTYLERWHWPLTVEDFLAYWFRHHTINSELLAAIQQLRQQGIRCYLATQQERYRTDFIWHDLGFSHLFDGMFSSVSIGYMKSHPGFFETVVRELKGCAPAEILFWDDQELNVTTARNTGIRAELYRDFAHFSAYIQAAR